MPLADYLTARRVVILQSDERAAAVAEHHIEVTDIDHLEASEFASQAGSRRSTGNSLRAPSRLGRQLSNPRV